MAFLIKKQSFKKLTVILRVTGKLLLKSKDMCLNEIFELTILMLTLCKNAFFLKIYNVDKLKRNECKIRVTVVCCIQMKNRKIVELSDIYLYIFFFYRMRF